HDRRGRMLVVILIVERQIVDGQLRERDVVGPEPGERGGQLSVERGLAQAADDDCNLEGHCAVSGAALWADFRHGRMASRALLGAAADDDQMLDACNLIAGPRHWLKYQTSAKNKLL